MGGHPGPPADQALCSLLWVEEQSGGGYHGRKGEDGLDPYSSYRGGYPPLPPSHYYSYSISSSTPLIVHPTPGLADSIVEGMKLGAVQFCGGLGALVAEQRLDLVKAMNLL